ncbi:hypothetical protein QBC35DRAFT_541050 [Podospora australis]|uniref:MARVEL domain-containing protein n=1 Tax=Podospora australis TaxID=1536484 RepID=A0AAN6WPS6_9PEZI|nr:hypothetical protein QBC35DRAFT_541050 [Podospora australis]
MSRHHEKPYSMGPAILVLRLFELVCSVICLGLLGRFLHLASEVPDRWTDGRLVYAIVVASISTLFSIVFILPFLYSCLAFPADFVLFIMWLVAFSLLAARSGSCNTDYYWNYWGYYWGRWWVNPFWGGWGYGGPCSSWRALLAFSFMASMAYLVSSILGGIVIKRHYNKDRQTTTGGVTSRNISAPLPHNTAPETAQVHTPREALPPTAGNTTMGTAVNV